MLPAETEMVDDDKLVVTLVNRKEYWDNKN